MNRIKKLFTDKKGNILSVYFTAGFPDIDSTIPVIHYLEEAGADLIEVGIPFSDPVADGPTIQDSNKKALHNGMTLRKLLNQLSQDNGKRQIPVLLMGYLNPILQYGIEDFCRDCSDAGVSGLIIPDLPMDEYLEDYQKVFVQYGLINIFLITPQTLEERIRHIDKHSNGFIYMVSSASTTGAKKGISGEQLEYFERISNLKLKNPQLIGFGISDHESFNIACQHAQGAIIGSAFIKILADSKNIDDDVTRYIKSVKGN
ncbi:tryptophan synthase subunit alpha [Bacteroidota bacterium]